MKENYIDTGKIRYVTLDLPLRNHPLAFKAAEATHCAQAQGKYHEMHDRLFAHQKALEPWSGHAEALGLDVDSFEACMSSGRFASGIRQDKAQADKVGITGTPTFVVTRTDPSDPKQVKGITTIRGAQAYAKFKTELDKLLGDGDAE